MKEILETITKNLNRHNQGYFEYIEQEYEDYFHSSISTHKTYLKFSIVRKYPEEKLLFMKSFTFNKHVEDTEVCRDKVREFILSEVLTHAVFGLKGVILL